MRLPDGRKRARLEPAASVQGPHAGPTREDFVPRNLLLASLDPADLIGLLGDLRPVRLRRGRIVNPPNLPFSDLVFIESGIVSVLASTGRQDTAQAWMTGREGVIGVAAILGQPSSPHRRIVEVDGDALSLPLVHLPAVLERVPALRAVLMRYVHTLLVQSSQLGACNAHHNVAQRVARWLLMAQDRLGVPEIEVTHAILARALGARRPTVSQAVEIVCRTGAVVQKRGRIEVVDRPVLERASCSCYRLLGQDFRLRSCGEPGDEPPTGLPIPGQSDPRGIVRSAAPARPETSSPPILSGQP
jgi:CRP-like cAMP-binding protein